MSYQRLSAQFNNIREYYLVKTPTEEVYFVTNLKDFARDHSLSKQCLQYVAEGKRKHHKRHYVMLFKIPYNYMNSIKERNIMLKKTLKSGTITLEFDGEDV